MPRFFADRITEGGREAYRDLLDHVSHNLNHGENGMEADHLKLILGSIHFVMGDHRSADALIRDHIFEAEEKFGRISNEVLSGLILLANNCKGWGRQEDFRCALEQVKLVRERCSFRRDSILEGLHDFAGRYHSAEDPANKQRGFILSLLELSWCVRYPSDHNYHEIPEVKVAGLHDIYTRHIPKLEVTFQSFGFVDAYWQWLIQHCNHNLNDLVGLISILRDKRLLPVEGRPSIKPEMREEALAALVREFPIHKETELERRILKSGGNPSELKFACPLCGSQELRTKFPEALYQISTLDAVKKDPGANCDPWYIDEREPSEYEGVGHTEEWEFWCDKCGLTPNLDQNYEEEPQEESLARWLLDNCPQGDDFPHNENSSFQS